MWIATAALILIGTGPQVLPGQSFGKNKVRHEMFNFRRYNRLTFDLLAYPPVDVAAVETARKAERWNHRYRTLFGHTLTERQPIIVYESQADFDQTNVIPGLIPRGVRGVTEGRGGRVVLPLSASNEENDHVLGHELVHAFHFDMLQGRSRAPLWLLEGMAEYATRGPKDAETAMWLRDAVAREDIPTIHELSRGSDYSPYRWGHALWAYIAYRYGDEVIGEFYPAALNRGMRKATESVLEISVQKLSEEWHAFLKSKFGDEVEGKTPRRSWESSLHRPASLSAFRLFSVPTKDTSPTLVGRRPSPWSS